jgi:hypothetical protein
MWTGEPIDIAHRDGGAYPLFTMAAGPRAALVDADIFRTIIRRNYFLDPLSILDEDDAMQERIEQIFGEQLAASPPRPGPTREDLLRTMQDAVAQAT